MSKRDNKGFFREWLETLQQESWQLELLISGLALFGIFESKFLLEEFAHYIDLNFFSVRIKFTLNVFLFILNGAWYIFIINLIIHIILRGLWIGAIGLRYVSEDIDYKNLKFAPYFEKLYTKRYKTSDDYIEELERICSVMFAYTFLLFFILISASLFLLWISVITFVFDEAIAIPLLFFYVFFGLLVFIDFIFLNPMKKIHEIWFSRIYGVIFRFYSTITLSFLFRPLLLNFIDNKFTKRLFLFSIPYGILIILILPRITAESNSFFPKLGQRGIEQRSFNSVSMNPDLYDNLRSLENKKKIEYVCLDNNIVKSNLLEFFFTMRSYDIDFLKIEKGIEQLHEVGIYTGFKQLRSKSSDLDSLKRRQGEKIVKHIKARDINIEAETEEFWAQKREDIEGENEKELKIFYKNRLTEITDAIISSSKFFIDDEGINEHMECFFAEHENLGEKGWKCFTPLDSLENGVHMFKIIRSTYDQKNKIKGSFELEFPFILDSKQN